MRAHIALCLLALVTLGCSSGYTEFDASTAHDAGVQDEGVSTDGGVPIGAAFTIEGCDSLVFDASAKPTCTAGPDRPLTFIPLGVGIDMRVWTFTGGTPATSGLLTPTSTWSSVGFYAVSLAAGGSGGSAVAGGSVKIVAGAAGAACLAASDCDASLGLTCLCAEGQGCPAGLDAGLCVRLCETTSCAAGEACIDLARGASLADFDGGVPDGGILGGFRIHACLPTCTDGTTCRSGFSCRTLPEVKVAASESDPYTWTQACFAGVLADVGASCEDTSGAPDGSRCLTGACEPLGAAGICTETCDTNQPCPSSAACVTIPSVGARCLARCTTESDCADPLLACQGPAAGGLGYTLPQGEPATTTLCSPKHCTAPADCEPAGSCVSVSGGQFCER